MRSNWWKIYGLICLISWLCACREHKTTAPRHGVPGAVVEVHLADSLLIFYSIVQREGTSLSNSKNDAWDTYTYEEAYLSSYALHDTVLVHQYTTASPCANENCAKHYTDRIVAIGTPYFAMKCFCSGNFVVIDARTGKVALDSAATSTRFPQLATGIASWQAHAWCLQLDAGDGQRYFLSLDSLLLRPSIQQAAALSGRSIPCLMPELRSVVPHAQVAGKRYYFDAVQGSNQQFLVVRGAKTGTNRSRMYYVGQAWLHPQFVAQHDYCAKAIETEGGLLVLHAKTWNPAGNVDMLSHIDSAGGVRYTVSLASIGVNKPDYCRFFAYRGLLYCVDSEWVTILKLASGKLARRVRIASLH